MLAHGRVELVVYHGVLLVRAGREGQSGANLDLEGHVAGHVEEDSVAPGGGLHQDRHLVRDRFAGGGLEDKRVRTTDQTMYLIDVSHLLGGRPAPGHGATPAAAGGGAVGLDAAGRGVDGQEHLLGPDLGHLHAPLVQRLPQQVGLVEQSFGYCFSHLPIKEIALLYPLQSCDLSVPPVVGKLDWLVFSVREHYQLNHWSFTVTRLHRKSHLNIGKCKSVHNVAKHLP